MPQHLQPLPSPPFSGASRDGKELAPQKFEVLARPRVIVHKEPSKSSEVLCSYQTGQEVLAQTQSYDGWLRVLFDGASGSVSSGWIRIFDPAQGGVMLRCRVLEALSSARDALSDAFTAQSLQKIQ